MHVAYLILAHTQPNHFGRLVSALKGPNRVFFVHIDARMNELAFRKALHEDDPVVFVEPRISVNWGGFSVVQATLALLSTAFAFELPFRRFCLLSGSDFPIKSNVQILEALASPVEFIRVDRNLNSCHNDSHQTNTTFYWFMDSLDPSLNRLSGKLPRQPYSRIDLFHGSAWWALTRDCVDYVLRFVSANADYYSFFKHAFCSDEIFFHSIIKQSPFASQIVHDFETVSDRTKYFLSNDHGCHYINWNDPADSSPKVLDQLDLDKLLNSKALFARKFQEPRSVTLVNILQNVLAQGPR